MISWKKQQLRFRFSSAKNIDRTLPNKNCKFIYVPKVKSATSSKGSEDLKMISVHSNFIDIMKEPIHKSKILDFVPRSVMMINPYVKSTRKKWMCD